MDQELRALQQQYQIEPTEENRDLYAASLIRAGLFNLGYAEERLVRNYLQKTMPQPEHKTEKFPGEYTGYLLVEMDETWYWSLETAVEAGYIGCVYLVDLTTSTYLAEMFPSYAAYPLYPTMLIDQESEIGEIIWDNWNREREEVDYFKMSGLRGAVDWRLLDDMELDPEEDPIKQLIEYCQSNHLL